MAYSLSVLKEIPRH